MPSRASYEVRVEGILGGRKDTTQNKQAIDEFQKVFPVKEPQKQLGALGAQAKWPDGFVLTNYDACFWKSDGYDFGQKKDRTLLAFNAEVSIFLPDAIYEPGVQNRLLKDVEWFYKYRDQAWFKDLYAKIDGLRNTLANMVQVVEPIRFQQWKWYCGNGGGD